MRSAPVVGVDLRKEGVQVLAGDHQVVAADHDLDLQPRGDLDDIVEEVCRALDGHRQCSRLTAGSSGRGTKDENYEVSVDTIFDDAPFDGFIYQLYDIPADMRPITIDALGQTRRQLLWAIAHDYNLKMTLLTSDGGFPSKVIIRWRGTGDTER